MNRAIGFSGISIFLMILVPDHFLPWPSFRHEVLIGSGFSCLCVFAAWKGFYFSKAAIPFLGLSIIPFIQHYFGLIYFWGDVWMAWLYIYAAALAVLTGRTIIELSKPPNSNSFLAPLIIALVMGGIFSVGAAICQWLGLSGAEYFIANISSAERPSANLGQPNQLALILLMALIGIIFLYESKRIKLLAGGVGSVFLIFGLALTQSRMSIVAMVFIFIFYWQMRKAASLSIEKKYVVAGAAVFSIFVIGLPLANEFLYLRVPATMSDRVNSDVRSILWGTMMDAVERSPWVGYGFGQIPTAQQYVSLDHPSLSGFYDSSHNIVLDLALWGGVPVAAAIVSFFSLFFFRKIKGCNDPLSWCLLSIMGVVLCHSLVEYPLHYAYVLLPTFLFLGALSADKAEAVIAWRVSRAASLSMACIAVMVFSVVVFEYSRFEEEWRDLRLSLARQMPRGGIEMSEPIILTHLYAYAEFVKKEPEKINSTEDLDQVRQVVRRFGFVSSLMKYAIVLALNGDLTAAEKQLAIVCKIARPRERKIALDGWNAISNHPAYAEIKRIKFTECREY